MVEPDDLHAKALTSILVGGQETLQRPPVFSCADVTHEPFRIMHEPVQLEEHEDPVLWGVVRTSGSDFDGDRTDIHDVLSLVWGGVLRAFGIGSAWLINEPHVVVPHEIGARHLLFRQCPWKINESSFETARKSLNAWSAFAYHLLDDVFQWDRTGNKARPDLAIANQMKEPIWADKVARFLRSPRDVTVIRRTFPRWIYWSSQSRGVTVVRLAKARLLYYRAILMPFAPEVANGQDAHALFANGIPNAIPYKLVERARKLLSLADDKSSDVLALPLDSHCLFLGDKTLVALRGECGREIFEDERKKWLGRRLVENRVFFAESRIGWRTPLGADNLEELCLDLVKKGARCGSC